MRFMSHLRVIFYQNNRFLQFKDPYGFYKRDLESYSKNSLTKKFHFLNFFGHFLEIHKIDVFSIYELRLVLWTSKKVGSNL